MHGIQVSVLAKCAVFNTPSSEASLLNMICMRISRAQKSRVVEESLARASKEADEWKEKTASAEERQHMQSAYLQHPVSCSS